MNEDEYVAVTNLTKIRIAKQVISDLLISKDSIGYRPFINIIKDVNDLHDVLSKLVDSHDSPPNPQAHPGRSPRVHPADGQTLPEQKP